MIFGLQDRNKMVRRWHTGIKRGSSYVKELNQLYTSGIIELYIAEQNNDTQAKADIFARFGLPHILK